MARRNARPPGERKREGSESLRCRRYRKKLGEAELARILKFRFSAHYAVPAKMLRYLDAWRL